VRLLEDPHLVAARDVERPGAGGDVQAYAGTGLAARDARSSNVGACRKKS
jgi:hypothetical protein